MQSIQRIIHSAHIQGPVLPVVQTFTGKSWNIFTADNRGTTVFELFLQVDKTTVGQESFLFVLFCLLCKPNIIRCTQTQNLSRCIWLPSVLTREFGRGAQISVSDVISYSIFLLLFLHDAVDSKSNPVNSLGFQFAKFPRWGYELINCGFERVEL